jgi:prepilin-type N-terminal cleavage/methylation domain-containing protein
MNVLQAYDAQYSSAARQGRHGFTIVELLIVIVVIGILAAVTIVAYSNVQARATEAGLKADLKNASTSLKITQTQAGNYPTGSSLPTGISASGQNVLQYSGTASTFCVVATHPNRPGMSYYITHDGTLMSGTCLSLGGENWTTRSAPSTGWYGIAYGNGRYVAIGSNGVMSSTDGQTWTTVSTPVTRTWRSVTYGGGKFVIIGDQTGTVTVLNSTDGITWTSHTGVNGYLWESVTHGNGRFVAVSQARTMTSTDGQTWTSNTAGPRQWDGVTFGNGRFVASALDTGTNGLMSSTDGQTWTVHTVSSASWGNITYGNGRFVAVSLGGLAAVSTDGQSWSTHSIASASWRGVAYGNGKFVAVSQGHPTNSVATSPDGQTWTIVTGAPESGWFNLIYANNLFVAVATGGSYAVMTSP